MKRGGTEATGLGAQLTRFRQETSLDSEIVKDQLNKSSDINLELKKASESTARQFKTMKHNFKRCADNIVFVRDTLGERFDDLKVDVGNRFDKMDIKIESVEVRLEEAVKELGQGQQEMMEMLRNLQLKS